MKIGAGGQPEDLLKDEIREELPKQEDKKLTFGEKFEQFWYFHKWQTIISVILAVGIGLGILQLIKNTEPDAYIMYIGPGYLSSGIKTTMVDTAADYLEDYNGDGKKYLSILDITAAVGDDIPISAYEANKNAVTRFNLEITTGDSVIFLMEESFYEKLRDFGVLEKLANIIDKDLLPDNLYDEYGVRVSNLDFFNQDGFSSVPGDTILCIRQSPDADTITYGRTMELWNSNKVLFKHMFSYVSNDDTPIPETYDVSPYDAVIMYIGYDRIYETTQKALSSSAFKYLTDSNNSESKDIGIDYRILMTSQTLSAYEANTADAEYFENQLKYGNNVIFLVEKSFYNKLYETGQLLSLETLFSYKNSEDETVVVMPDIESEDGYGIQLSQLDFFKDIQGFGIFADDLMLCVRARPESCDKSHFNSCVDFYRQILYYKTQSESNS
ncbi:MAG: hypothetical protein PHW77_01930 [Eubacteriales bacterium]|nr:hypothetical protein [Eubacteriales bacterium]